MKNKMSIRMTSASIMFLLSAGGCGIPTSAKQNLGSQQTTVTSPTQIQTSEKSRIDQLQTLIPSGTTLVAKANETARFSIPPIQKVDLDHDGQTEWIGYYETNPVNFQMMSELSLQKM